MRLWFVGLPERRESNEWLVTAVLALVLLAAFLTSVMPAMGAASTLLIVAALALLLVQTVRIQRQLRESFRVEHDASARAQLTESRAKRREAMLDTLADGLDLALFLCDGRANIQYSNTKARGMFSFDAMVGKPLLVATMSHALEGLVRETAATGNPQYAELVFGERDDRIGLARTWREAGEDGLVFLSIHDITGLRHLERARQDFVANVSHELRTPLTTIRAMAETLQDDDEVSRGRREKYLSQIIREVDRLALLTSDLLALSFAESRRVTKTPCDLAELTHGIVSQMAERASAKGLQLTFSGPEALTIPVDASQISQVVLNLIDNAIKYTVEGSVRVTLAETENGASLECADTGIGIPSEAQQRIFERFYRVDKARSRESGGTGLGLSIVKHIVEAHGGSVTVESALNRGSVFTIHLPAE